MSLISIIWMMKTKNEVLVRFGGFELNRNKWRLHPGKSCSLPDFAKVMRLYRLITSCSNTTAKISSE